MSRRLGADVALDAREVDVVEEVRCLTGGWMADVAVEAVGTPDTFLTALRLTPPAGVLSSIGNYGMRGTLTLPLDTWSLTSLQQRASIAIHCRSDAEPAKQLAAVLSVAGLRWKGLRIPRKSRLWSGSSVRMPPVS